MKTFDAFLKSLVEADHYLDYGKWGIISNAKRKVIMGNQHPTATTHKELGATKKDVEFAQDIEGGFLSVRTYSLEALKLLRDHFESIPHMRSGMITHTHFGTMGMDEKIGKSYEILDRVKRMIEQS